MCTRYREGGFSRRKFVLCSAAATLAALIAPQALTARGGDPIGGEVRILHFHNLHTGETLRATYWEHGRYVPDALAGIDLLLRDHRRDAVHPIDTGLLDTLHTLQSALGFDGPYEVISGYRSPETNEMLRSQGRAVAERSLHTEGKAIDVSVPGIDLHHLRDVALALEAGGVGHYANPGFLHIDVGRVRTW
jgi:uncharacterized protein YcbK (DUF882 family)